MRSITSFLVCCCLSVVVGGCGDDSGSPTSTATADSVRSASLDSDALRQQATERYLKSMDVQSFRRRGSDYVNPEYSPLRLGKSLDELDDKKDYDFERLDAVVKKLENVDRRTVFRELFQRICAHCSTDQERHLAVLDFCTQASFHNRIQPLWPDGRGVYDPLVCLELGEHRCGQTARIVVALFDAAGYPARLAQFGGHVAGEVFYDDDWHYVDANLFGADHTCFDADGTIPSYVELSREPFAIDAMPSYLEATFGNVPRGSAAYPSWYFFSKQAYVKPPRYYVKTATLEQERRSRSYGWEHRETIVDEERVLGDFDKRYAPGAPRNLRLDGDLVLWDPADDRDGDLIGYRVYVGSKSRGWCYGPDWKPEMYHARFSLPPSDVALIETTETYVQLPEHRPLYVTVMAYDEHGEAVGRELYRMSRELVVR